LNCFEDKEYYTHVNLLTSWHDAWSACLNYGLEFVSLDSKREKDLFIDLCKRNDFASNWIHIGAVQEEINNYSSYVWVSSNRYLDYNFTWARNEPNNFNNLPELCLSLTVDSGCNFNDVWCDSEIKFAFVCQKLIVKDEVQENDESVTENVDDE